MNFRRLGEQIYLRFSFIEENSERLIIQVCLTVLDYFNKNL